MKLESQVVSLDLAKRLKELGVKQESVFQWVLLGGHNPPVVRYEYGSAYHALVEASAFTVAELGEILPLDVYTVKDKKGFYCWSDREWTNEEGLFDDHLDPIHADTEADARAKILIYLLENKLVTCG